MHGPLNVKFKRLYDFVCGSTNDTNYADLFWLINICFKKAQILDNFLRTLHLFQIIVAELIAGSCFNTLARKLRS